MHYFVDFVYGSVVTKNEIKSLIRVPVLLPGLKIWLELDLLAADR
jgi:hypothetical protein